MQEDIEEFKCLVEIREEMEQFKTMQRLKCKTEQQFDSMYQTFTKDFVFGQDTQKSNRRRRMRLKSNDATERRRS